MDLVEELSLAEPMPHEPAFQVRTQGIYHVVTDGGNVIAVVVRDKGTGGALLDVLRFRPSDPTLDLVLPEGDYHYATRLGFGATFNWSVDSMFQSPDQDRLDLIACEVDSVVFQHAGEYQGGTTLDARLAIGYDAAMGQYSYAFTWDIASTRTVTGEFSNVFHRNLMHSNMDMREYDYGTYVRKGGSWETYPVSIMVTGLVKDRLTRVPLEVGGGSGHINRSGVVPMIIHRRANAPLYVGSCDTCFDLHQTADVSAGTTTRIESRFQDVGSILAAHPDAASAIALDNMPGAYSFHVGKCCDFTETLSPTQPWSGGIWAWQGQQPAVVTNECAHSGQHCLKLVSSDDAAILVSPYGPELTLVNNRRYRLSAWCKLDGGKGSSAGISLSAFRFTPSNSVSRGESCISDSTDWTRLDVIIDSRNVECGQMLLTVQGKAIAFFDDILVEQLD